MAPETLGDVTKRSQSPIPKDASAVEELAGGPSWVKGKVTRVLAPPRRRPERSEDPVRPAPEARRKTEVAGGGCRGGVGVARSGGRLPALMRTGRSVSRPPTSTSGLGGSAAGWRPSVPRQPGESQVAGFWLHAVRGAGLRALFTTPPHPVSLFCRSLGWFLPCRLCWPPGLGSSSSAPAAT